MLPGDPTDGGEGTMVLEAFADTILPGAKRHPDDRAVAGVATGGGAVAAGAVALLSHPAGGFAPLLDACVSELNRHAREYATQRGVVLAEDVAAFVALPFDDRTVLVAELCGPDHPERQLWVGLALFSYMAYDSAAHMSTRDALAAGHPGLTAMGFAGPDSDGLWRFPVHSFGRPLADLHPGTTANGSPS